MIWYHYSIISLLPLWILTIYKILSSLKGITYSKEHFSQYICHIFVIIFNNLIDYLWSILLFYGCINIDLGRNMVYLMQISLLLSPYSKNMTIKIAIAV